jgi:hypothetical protein
MAAMSANVTGVGMFILLRDDGHLSFIGMLWE